MNSPLPLGKDRGATATKAEVCGRPPVIGDLVIAKEEQISFRSCLLYSLLYKTHLKH
jgi:hypothetical protein